jgi:hypothetical protein
LRIAVLTPHRHRYGLKLLNLLRWTGVDVAQVLLFTDRWRPRLRWARRSAGRVGWIGFVRYVAQGVWSSPFRGQGVSWRGRPLEPDYTRLAGRVDFAPDARAPAAVEALHGGAPDLCLLAATEIIPRAVLDIPRLATLNAHPGVLPVYRGLDPQLWPLVERRFDDVGCTLHVVDAGVDTGPILEVRRYRWQGDETLDRLLWRLNETCLDLLAGACREAWPAYLERATPQGEGRLYHLLPPGLRGQALRNLAAHRTAC